MSDYSLGGGYDGWKLSTPWDDEKIYYVSFDCSECGEANDSVEAVGSKGYDEATVYCAECNCRNTVDVGGDW